MRGFPHKWHGCLSEIRRGSADWPSPGCRRSPSVMASWPWATCATWAASSASATVRPSRPVILAGLRAKAVTRWPRCNRSLSTAEPTTTGAPITAIFISGPHSSKVAVGDMGGAAPVWHAVGAKNSCHPSNVRVGAWPGAGGPHGRSRGTAARALGATNARLVLWHTPHLSRHTPAPRPVSRGSPGDCGATKRLAAGARLTDWHESPESCPKGHGSGLVLAPSPGRNPQTTAQKSCATGPAQK